MLTIFREKYERSALISTIGQYGIDEPVIVFLCPEIIERDSISFDGWRVEKEIVIQYLIWLHDEAVSQIISTDKSPDTTRWYIFRERVIAVWLLEGSVWEELDGELCVFIRLDHFTTIDEVRRLVCLRKWKSWKKWLLIEDKSLFIDIGWYDERRKESKDEEEFFHDFIYCEYLHEYIYRTFERNFFLRSYS
jgi:hypothetical protein